MTMPTDTVSYIERTRTLYSSQKPYRWVVNDPADAPPAFTPITKPLSELKIALFSSGGVYRADQEPFHFRNDTSHREIPLGADPAELRVAHFGYDFSDAAQDPECVLPRRALASLVDEGVVGALVDPALSFMGGIYSARRVREEVATRFRDFVVREEADLAYLVPA
jgi:D-proline reductase (dithiol) PrdB